VKLPNKAEPKLKPASNPKLLAKVEPASPIKLIFKTRTYY